MTLEVNQIKKAMEMWENGFTHGEIKQETGLSHELEIVTSEIAKKYNLTTAEILAKSNQIQAGMKYNEIEAIYAK